MFNAKSHETDWDLVKGRKKVRIHVSGPISNRDLNSIRSFVVRGHGLGLLPSADCDEALASGGLIRLLPKWTSHAASDFRRLLEPEVSAFEVESIPGGSGVLEEPVVDQRVMSSGEPNAAQPAWNAGNRLFAVSVVPARNS